MPEPDDHAFARELAVETGQLLVALRARMSAEGASSWELKDEGDRQAHEFLLGRLAADRPDDAILSEEGSGGDGSGRYASARLHAERVWIIDPLDGTREFSEPP